MQSIKNFSIRKKGKGWLKFVIGTLAFLFLIWVLNIFVLPIKNSFFAFSAPMQQFFWSVGSSSSSFLASLTGGGRLAKENELLKQENQKLLSQIAALKSIEQANQAQNDISIACQNASFNIVMAGVIGLDDNDIISINKGQADGITEGMPVINQQNVLFGSVFKVYKNFSEIKLISNKSSVVNVKVQGDNLDVEIDGTVKGTGGLNAYLDLVPVNSEINSEDILVTSAIDKLFPKDLLVGKIISKQKNDQQPFQQAQISLFFDVKAVDNLFVITNYKRAN